MSETSAFRCEQTDGDTFGSRSWEWYAAAGLFAAALVYAVAVTAFLPRQIRIAEVLDVFLSGAVPGLLVTLVLWAARPSIFVRSVRQAMLGTSLSGAAIASLALLACASF